MNDRHGHFTHIKTLSGAFGISNKILFVVLLIILLFSVGLTVSVGVTGFRKFTDITMNELNTMSGVFARKIEELEKNSLRLVATFNGNKHLLEQMNHLSNKGPTYALEPGLMNSEIEESERIYFFQAQLKLINILQPLLHLNNLDSIQVYLSSPFDMVQISEAVPVLKITGDFIYVSQFRQKSRVKESKWFKLRISQFAPPPPDYFDISSVYSLPLTKFYNDFGFTEAGDNEVTAPLISPELSGFTGSDVNIRGNIPIFKTWHAIESRIANPETFEEEDVVAGYIVVEEEFSESKMKIFEEELGTDLAIGLFGKLLLIGNKNDKEEVLLSENKRVLKGGVEYYYSSKKIVLNSYRGLSAVTLSPVSVLNKHTRSLSGQIALTGIAVMLIAGILIFTVVQSQVRKPLNKLMSGVSSIAEGNFKSRVYITSKDEFGKLANAFNEMSMILNSKTETLHQTVSELQKAQNYISNIINSMPSVLIGVDNEGMVTQWNSEAQRKTGLTREEAAGQPLDAVIPRLSLEMDRIRMAMAERRELTDPKRIHQESGHTVYEDVVIYPLIANGVEGAVIRLDDVTEKVRLEEMMVQSEKMLSVGGLAAGMAHEINNPLAGMMQNAGVMRDRLTNIDIPANVRAAEEIGLNLEKVRSYMEKRGILKMLSSIHESGKRVAGIVDNMLSFARKGEADYYSVDICDLIDKSVELASTDYDLKKQYDFKRIEIRKEYDEGLPYVPCEGAKIQQVILNILRNGAQAMQGEATEKPVLTLRARRDTNRAMVCIEIEDNGPGMDEDTRKRAFEPFFTSKPVGIGTGLGLSVSYFIITENHNGEMAVESIPGAGAKFIICLPLERKKM